MKLFEVEWTPESADRWTLHDLAAALLSPFIFFLFTIGSLWAVFGNPVGWFFLAMAVGASLLLWAIIDRKLKVQSVAFRQREQEHKDAVDERNRWEG